MSFVAIKGAPIWDYREEEIWAYWAETRRFDASRVLFLSANGLLGTGPSVGPRTTAVFYERNHWIASADCIQSDFRHNPWFVMNPLQGPQASLMAIRTLLEDKVFLRFTADPMEQTLNALRAYERYAEQRAKETSW